jgi:hypothetical protein
VTASRSARKDPGPATGTPAPFTQEHVDALVRGSLDEAVVATILESHRPGSPVPPRRRRRKGSPEELGDGDLAELRLAGRPSVELTERLERADARRSARPAKTDAGAQAGKRGRPRSRPPA